MSTELTPHKMGDFLRVKHGFPFLGEFFSTSGKYIVLTPGNFYESGGFKRTFGKEKYYISDFLKEYLCSEGDLIVAMTEQAEGLLGSTAIIPENGIYLHNQRIGLISWDVDVVDKHYLYYLFMTRSVRKQIRDTASGTKVKHTSPERIYDVDVFVPDITVQQNNAALLWMLDKKIQLNNCIIAELETMAKTIYDYWFVQFDFPDENGRPYRSSGGEMGWNEQLKREIPIGWKIESIVSLFDVCYGYPFDTKQFVDEPNHQPVVRIRDILDSDTSAYTTESVDNKYWLCSKDLIIGMDGNFHMNFWHSTPALLNQRCVRIRGNGKHSALQAYFSAAPYIKAREQNVNRTTVGHLSADDIKALHVLTPPKELQNKATEMFESFLEKICAAKKENIELAKFRNWLLPMLMNGQVRVE